MADGKPSKRLTILEPPDEIKLRTWIEMVRTSWLIQRQVVAALMRHDVTLPQFDVLATLRFSEGVTQQELAERLLVTKGNVCGVLDRLESAGWVERRPDAHDKRANRLHLTGAGRRKIQAVLPDHDRCVLQAMRSLSASDAKTLRSLLHSLTQANDEKT